MVVELVIMGLALALFGELGPAIVFFFIVAMLQTAVMMFAGADFLTILTWTSIWYLLIGWAIYVTWKTKQLKRRAALDRHRYWSEPDLDPEMQKFLDEHLHEVPEVDVELDADPKPVVSSRPNIPGIRYLRPAATSRDALRADWERRFPGAKWPGDGHWV